VDGFQGQEKDIIILSTVRSGSSPTIGFLKDARRMNVALTRAKSSLFVIGNARTLERGDERWKTIVGDARDRGFLIDVRPFLSHLGFLLTRSMMPRRLSLPLWMSRLRSRSQRSRKRSRTRPRHRWKTQMEFQTSITPNQLQ
jgi:ATP-dependent exoDNAse (exonuclease V) beta subunit